MPGKFRWERRVGWVLQILLFLLLVVAGLRSPSNLLVAIILAILMVYGPRWMWTILAEKPSTPVLRVLPWLNKLPERVIRFISGSKRPIEFELFFANRSQPHSLWWRIAQVFFLDLFITSFIVPKAPLIGNGSTNEFAEFLIIGLLGIALASPILVLAWTYEDSGLRCFDRSESTVGVIGSRLTGIIAGASALGSFYNFVVSTSRTQAEAYYALVGLSLILLPPCFLATEFFHRKHEETLIDRLLTSKYGKSIGFRKIALIAQDAPVVDVAVAESLLGSLVKYTIGSTVFGFLVGAILGAILYALGFLPCVFINGLTMCVNDAGPVVLGLGLLFSIGAAIVSPLVFLLKRRRKRRG